MTQMLRLLFLSLVASNTICTPIWADNWPGWRGPNGDGTSSESELPIRWSLTENLMWKIPLNGVGHSSPIVWEDGVYVTVCRSESMSRHLIRFDRQSGQVEWDRQIAVSPIEPMHSDNSPASATPATDGQRVYVVFVVEKSLVVTAVDLSGEIVWTRKVDQFDASHGFCSSLVLDENRLYLSGLQDGPAAFVACLDKNSGEVLWRLPRSQTIRSYSTPQMCMVRGTPAILLSGAGQTIAYDRIAGRSIWEIDGPASKTVSSIVISPEHDLAFVCGGRDNQFLAIDLQNQQPNIEPTPKIAWRANKGIPYMTSPLLIRGRLHVLSDEGIYQCFQPESGELLYQRRAVGSVKASMVANDQYIYVTETNGRTTVITTDGNWNVIAQNDIHETIVASMAVSNGDLVLRGDKHLFLVRQQ